LADALKTNQTVHTIDIDGNAVGAAGATALADALKSNQTVLKIDLCKMGLNLRRQKRWPTP